MEHSNEELTEGSGGFDTWERHARDNHRDGTADLNGGLPAPHSWQHRAQ